MEIPNLTSLTLAPQDAACWICLGEGNDTDGQLRRACSCRGESAGFAHFSCLVDYAWQKCKAVPDHRTGDFSTPWVYCSNCEQPFMSTLALDMANEFVSFVETTYSGSSSMWNKLRVLLAMLTKLQATCNTLFYLAGDGVDISADDDSRIREDGKNLITKFSALIDAAKQDKNLYQDNWVHMPKSSTEYQYYVLFKMNYEAQGCKFAGRFYSIVDRSEESCKLAIRYLKKADIIFKLVAPSMGLGLKLKRDIAELQARLDGVRYDNRLISLKEAKLEYEQAKMFKDLWNSDMIGRTSEIITTVGSGGNYVQALAAQFHIIEAERLAKELELKSRRFLGPENHTTKRVVDLLQHCKKRYVYLLHSGGQHGLFNALNCESCGGGSGSDCVFIQKDTTTQIATIQTGRYSGDKYLVTGPIADRAEVKGELELYIACDIVFPCPGCPVVCHGLKSATHLNGKLGSLRTDSKYYAELEKGRMEFGVKDVRCTVYFDDESLKSVSVKLENLRIVFDLDSFD